MDGTSPLLPVLYQLVSPLGSPGNSARTNQSFSPCSSSSRQAGTGVLGPPRMVPEQRWLPQPLPACHLNLPGLGTGCCVVSPPGEVNDADPACPRAPVSSSKDWDDLVASVRPGACACRGSVLCPPPPPSAKGSVWGALVPILPPSPTGLKLECVCLGSSPCRIPPHKPPCTPGSPLHISTCTRRCYLIPFAWNLLPQVEVSLQAPRLLLPPPLGPQHRPSVRLLSSSVHV